MRATQMNHRVHRRTVLALLTSSLLVLSALGASPVSAATPDLIVTGSAAPGTAGDTATTAQPTVVSTGETIQFTTSIYNDDTSNVSQLYFDLAGDPSGFTVTKLTSSRSANDCSLTATPLCTFGALRPDQSVTVTVILTAPAIPAPPSAPAPSSCLVGSNGHLGATETLSFGGSPAFCVDLRWYSNGFPTSDGGTSHGDFFDWFDGAGLNGDAINFRGRFVYLDGQKTVANSLSVSNSNKQGTQATVNNLNIPVTVQDGPTIPRICTGVITLTNGTTFDCGTLTSETSIVDVANGNTVALFAIFTKFNQAPTNLKGNAPVALHEYVDPATQDTIVETIASACKLKNGVPTAASPIPCLTVANGGKQVTIWNTHNGKFNY